MKEWDVLAFTSSMDAVAMQHEGALLAGYVVQIVGAAGYFYGHDRSVELLAWAT